MTSGYFRLVLSITCSLGPIIIGQREPANLPTKEGLGWDRDAGKICPLLALAPPHPLPHLEVPFQNHQLPKLEGLKSSSGPTLNMELGTLKGRDWPKVAEQHRVKMVMGKGNVE